VHENGTHETFPNPKNPVPHDLLQLGFGGAQFGMATNTPTPGSFIPLAKWYWLAGDVTWRGDDMVNCTKLTRIPKLALLVLLLNASMFAAGEVDTSFRANLTAAFGSGTIRELAVQPDGKILIAGTLGLVNGAFQRAIGRLNPDGTPDLTFTPPQITSAQYDVNVIRVMPNGKILVGGGFETATRQSLMRLNADGTLDPTFTNVLTSFGRVNDIAVYPDGRLLIGGDFQIQNVPGSPGYRAYLVRTDADGNLDPELFFNAGYVRKIHLFPDGRILVASYSGNFPEFHNIDRRNSDGSRDTTFAITATNNITDWSVLASGKILVVQSSGNQLLRVNENGENDTTFPIAGITGSIYAMIPDSNGHFYIAGDFTQIGNNASYRKLARLNSDGFLDPSFIYSGDNFNYLYAVGMQPTGKIVVGGAGITTDAFLQNPVARINTNGITDETFRVPIAVNFGTGYKVIVQPDNKVLVGGSFQYANGYQRGRIVRFNADGTVDTGFTPQTYNQGVIFDLSLQPDGKILVAGSMGVVHRLNPDGTLDLAFPSSTINKLELEYLPDGKVLIADTDLRRYTSTGFDDGLLATVSGGAAPHIQEIKIQPDGKILIAGSFTTVNGAARTGIARLNANGSIDGSFNPQANVDVNSITVLANEKILIGGNFTSVGGDASKQNFARLNPDGSLDSTFSVVLNGPIFGAKVQPDGRILVGGAMSHVNGILMPRLARLNINGSLDASFNVGTGPDSTVWSIDQDSTGRVLFAGEFVRTNGNATPGIGRILNNAVPASRPFDYDGDGRSDVSVFRASENRWYILRSSDGAVSQPVFATGGDVPVPADYDGDQKTDVAIFRPSTGQWWYLSSLNGSQVLNPFGQTGDIPRPSDFDGDGKTDFVLFRPSDNKWYRFGSSVGATTPAAFGSPGDQPVIGDFDGDGKNDLAVFRPSTGDWWYAASSSGGAFRQTHWGQNGDLPVPADYDGDAKTDLAVFRPSDGGWYVLNSSNGSNTSTAFGTSGDRPAAADYDGDGRADLAVFRPSTGIWYLLRSTSGFAGVQFGIVTDTPTPGSYVP
jgi:uncharacterized delta-60 repeat protein